MTRKDIKRFSPTKIELEDFLRDKGFDRPNLYNYIILRRTALKWFKEGEKNTGRALTYAI